MLKDILDALIGVLTFFKKRRPLHWYDTGAATTIKVFFPTVPHKLLEIRLKLAAAFEAAEDFTITKTNTETPSNLRDVYYDVILFFEEIGDTGITSLVMPFEADEGFMEEADSLVFAFSANNGTTRWGIEVVYELV